MERIKNHRGSICISVLVFSLLIAVFIHSFSQALIHTIQLLHHRRFTPQLQRELIHQLLVPSKGETIRTEKRETNRQTLYGTLSYHLPGGENSLLKIQDLSLLSETCPLENTHQMFPLPHKLVLSPVAPLAVSTCVLPKMQIGEGFRTNGNLSVGRLSQEEHPSKLFINGFLYVQDTITVTHDILIVSGGDILVEQIKVLNPESEIALVSLSGGVRIGTLKGTHELFVDSLTYQSLPRTALNLPNTSLIQDSDGWVEAIQLGVRATHNR